MPSSPLPEAKEGSIREGAEIVEGEVSPPGDANTTGVGKRHKAKRSLDAGGTVNGKSHDRLSIFGSSFVSSTLGKGKGKEKTKGRKPPPRYSVGMEDPPTKEKDREKEASKGSGFHIPGMSMGRKSSAGRPGTSDGTTPPSKETALLRKRTTSHPGSPTTSSPVIAPTSSPSAPLPSSDGLQPKPVTTTAVVPPSSTPTRTLNPSLPILTQIGTPDFSGWIRKRGEKYRNNWKLRYCVLKGGDLYVLRGDGANVSLPSFPFFR